jgi:hypothetical protein
LLTGFAGGCLPEGGVVGFAAGTPGRAAAGVLAGFCGVPFPGAAPEAGFGVGVMFWEVVGFFGVGSLVAMMRESSAGC